MDQILTFFVIPRTVVGFVCLDRCPAEFHWSCIPGTVVCGLFFDEIAPLNFAIASTENCPTLMTPQKYNINKTTQVLYVNRFINVGVAGRSAEGVGKGGLRSSCVYEFVATAFRRRLMSCKPALLLGMCPQVVGKVGIIQHMCVHFVGRRRS